MSDPKNNQLALRIVLAFWLLGWFIKAEFFSSYLFSTILQYPVTHDMFPVFFKNPSTVQFFYLLPLTGLLVIFRPQVRLFLPISLMLLISSSVLACHIDTYNDATFVTSWWVALWLVWSSYRIKRRDENLSRHACSLAKAVLGVIFFGGFIGKLTPEYWDGTVIYNLFFVQAPANPIYQVTQIFPQGSAQSFAHAISIFIILGEGFLSLSPFLPNRVVFMVGPAMMSGITLFSTWRILSVLGCLIGLMLGALYLDRVKEVKG